MKVKNDYANTLTNIAASIQKYFGVQPTHSTFTDLDKLLQEHNPEKVVLLLYDGLGANILKRQLPEDSFFRCNLKRDLTTVFPATTTAATTSVRTGLNPSEHGFVGWTAYIEPIDKVITLFKDSEKGNDEETCEEFLEIKNGLLKTKTITEQINESGDGEAIEIMPFGEDAYDDLDGLLEQIKDETLKPGKRFVYAYDLEPDATMHAEGPDSENVKELIAIRDKKTGELASQLHKTLLIIVADHGHLKTKTLFLEDYPDIMALLTHKTAVDQRAAMFKIKKGKHKEFEELFNKYFGDYYDLFDSNDVKQSKLFGDGKEHPLFDAEMGDYLAIAKSDVSITAPGDHNLVSHHAGYTDDEILIPFIAKYCE